MKLVRLLLHAFGPFTDKTVDFAAGPDNLRNLHLIYGPNEAGKSSALRAITDLRFGIPVRSPDDFIHPMAQMRVAGVFVDGHGEQIGLVRRKGRGATLSRFDVATGVPDPVLPVLREHELALTGGVERGEFEAMFGLNHARLRAGGDLLLKGEGELGSALFEASAGTRGIAKILAELDDDAKKLFNPHGRAQNATINEARRQLDEQRSAWRAAQTPPREWQALHRAHEEARAALAAVDGAIEALRRRGNELAELRTVEPLLRQHERALADLAALATAPELPESAREERLAAEQAQRQARQALHDAQLELDRCAKALAALTIEAPLLEHAEAIERLAAGVEGAARSRIEAGQQRAIVERIDGELTAAAARIAAGAELSAVLHAAPSAADRVALNHHLQAIGLLDERLAGQRERARELEEALHDDAEGTPVAPDPALRQAVGEALRAAQALGDVARSRRESDRRIGDLEGRLLQSLADIGAGSEQALRQAQPLLDAQIAQARQTLAALDDAMRDARDEDQRLDPQLEEQRLRLRQLEAAGEVVTAETLRLARARRDDGWNRIRRIYVERADGAAASPAAPDAAFDPQRPLPDAFAAAQDEADRQADLLRADAQRAAAAEECSTRIGQMVARRGELAAMVASLAAQRADVLAGWTASLAQARLPLLDADALREWQVRREAVLELAGRLAELRTEREAALAEAAAAASALGGALNSASTSASTGALARASASALPGAPGAPGAAGQAPAGSNAADAAAALPTLIAHALQWEQKAAASDAEHGARAKLQRARQAERKKLDTLILGTATDLQGHVAELATWHARLFLPPASAPETVQARLEELDALARQAAALSDARQAHGHHQAVVADIAVRAAQLADLLGEKAPVAIDDFADRLKKRLLESRQGEQLRIALSRDRDRAQQQQRQAEAELARQDATLTRLCAAAGVATADLLPEKEEGAAARRHAQLRLSTLVEQLGQASARPQAALREALAGRDAGAIDSERERCRLELAQREAEQAAARQAEEQSRRALEAIDTSDAAAAAREAMESAAARFRAAIRPWARLRLAHALLGEALNRFRERAQAPMVTAASEYFSLMTGGRYRRLVADEADDKPVLRAERDDGARIGVEAMSDGTADQLYLALRLAALDLRRASHPHMPLVLDDVLITADDGRAANMLRALARFAEGGQVLIFTHHRHLLDVARAALGEQAFAVHEL